MDEFDLKHTRFNFVTGKLETLSHISEDTRTTIDDEWRDIMFLPFNDVWECFLVIVILIDINFVYYNVVFKVDNDIISVLHVLVAGLYFIDTSLSIMHRNMKNYRKKRSHMPRNLFSLTVDVITLLPIYEIYHLVKYTAGVALYSDRSMVRLQSLPRLYRVIQYFSKLRNTAGLDQRVIASIYQIVRIYLITSIMSIVWYHLSEGKVSQKTWTSNIKSPNFNSSNSMHWYLVCYCTMGSMFLHNAISEKAALKMSVGAHYTAATTTLWCNFLNRVQDLVAWNTVTELVIVSMTILSGYLFHIMLAYGELTAAYLKQLKRHFQFSRKYVAVKKLLDEWQVDDEVKLKTDQYYHEFWRKRRGYRKVPPLIDTLPLSLSKHVRLDIFWDALRHSHVLGGEDMAFKKTIAVMMRNDFYLPGDIVFKGGELRNKLIYVISGIIQVLSEEDDDSPILSFSNGTVIGEACCIRYNISTVVMRCATYCELQTLTMQSLYRTLLVFPSRTNHFLSKLSSRIEKAKVGVQVVARNYEQKKNSLVMPETTIKSLKRRWRLLAAAQKDKKITEVEDQFDGVHTSEYLDMLVLSDDVDLKLKAIFLTKNFPFILDPDSSVAMCWQWIVVVAVLVMFVMVPLYVCFRYRVQWLRLLLIFLDVIYILDVFVQMSTAIKLKQQTVTTVGNILLLRFKRMRFIIDIIAALPMDHYLYFCTDMSLVYINQIKLLRLLKVHKVAQVIFYYESMSWEHLLILRLVKYLFFLMILMYTSAALLFTYICMVEKHCDSRMWYLKGDYKPEESDYLGNVIDSLFYVCTVIFGARVAQYKIFYISEYFTAYMVALIGYMVLSFFFSELCALYVLKLNHESEFVEEMVGLRTHLFNFNIPKALFKRLQDFLSFLWKFNQNAKILGKDGILDDASEDLKNLIFKKRVTDVLRLVPLFNDCSEQFFNLLYQQVALQVVPPNFELTQSHYKMLNIRIISRGFCVMTSEIPIDKAYRRSRILKRGDAFPIIETFHAIPCFIDVLTLTAVELLYIDIRKIANILKAEREILEALHSALALHMSEFQPILMKKAGRLPEMIPTEKSLGRGKIFTYTIIDPEEEIASSIPDPYGKLGKIGNLIKLIMLPWTIYPKSPFYITWECVVCLLICKRLLFSGLRFNLLARAYNDYYLVLRSFDLAEEVFFWVDIYIRMHLQYYNKDGILVTHNLYTARNYIQTNFPIDVMVALPFRWLDLTNVFGKRYAYLTEIGITILFRPVQLYHVLGALSYFQIDTTQARTNFLRMLKSVIVLFVILVFFANVFALSTCVYIPGELMYACGKDSWFTSTVDNQDFTTTTVFVQSLYVAVVSFTSGVTGAFYLQQNNAVILFMFLILAGAIIRIHFIASITSSGIGGNTTLTKFQQQVSVFLHFVKNETVDEDLIQETINHYEHMFKKSKGRNFNKLMDMFHTTLKRDFGVAVYAATLYKSQLFRNADPCFYSHLACDMLISYYKKDAEIIRCNDVQHNLFVVHRGFVDIYVAKQKICTLSRGGIFGDLQQKPVRQTISAYAKVHTDIIYINSNAFHKVIKHYENIKERIKNANTLNTEFWESTAESRLSRGSQAVPQSEVEIDVESTDSRMFSKSGSRTQTFAKIARKTIKHNSLFYEIWVQIMCFHVAAISSLVISYFIFMGGDETFFWFSIFKYTLDVLYLSKIYIGFRLSYLNPDSGLTITDLNTIGWKYFKRMLWLDVFTLFPADLVLLLLGKSTTWVKYFSINRIFRYVYMLLYHNECKYKLKVSMYVRWSYLIYDIIFATQILTCVWWICACTDNMCSFRKSNDESKQEFVKEKSTYISNLLAYQYIINLFTISGLRSTTPITKLQVFVTIFITLISQYITAVVARAVASYLVVKYSEMSEYEYNIHELRDYLKLRDLSPSILQRMWQYLLDLWFRQNGQWMPVLIQRAPYYLKQDIMFALYGKHLENHFLFAKTHVDFLRQLVCYLKRCVYFPQNYITEKNDVDACMYFIHTGEVEVFDIMGKNEIMQRLLTNNMSFGEAQGLYNVPHAYSFKAHTIVDILILRRNEWSGLLKWFPASKEQIETAAAQNLLQKPEIQRAYDFHF